MFNSNPFSEYRATQQKVQEKKAFDAESIDGSTVADVDASIQEKFVIPEDIPATERTAFYGAAAAAHKAGKTSFNFGGKTHPVTMKKDTAKAIVDEAVTVKGTPRAGNNPFRGGRPTVRPQTGRKPLPPGADKLKRPGPYGTGKPAQEGVYKDMDTEKGETLPRSDAKVKSDMKKRRKTEKSDVNMNPKMDKGSKDNSMEQKESTGIRAKLMSVLSEKNDRAKHYKGATKPEDMQNNLKGQGAKDMVNVAKEVDDTEEKGHQDAVKAGKTGPQAKARSGGDNTKNGDQKIIPSATPAKSGKMAKTMEAYASMYNKIQEDKNGSGTEDNYKYNVHGYTGERGDEGHHAMLAKAKARNVKVSTARNQPKPASSTDGKHIILRGKKKDVDHVIDNHIGRDE